MRKNINRLLVLFVVLATGLAGCNLPRADQASEPDVTQAYETVSARLTEAAALTPPATSTTAPTATTAATTPTNQSTAATPTVKATSAPTSPAKLCDQAAPGVPIDVTVPDDTKMQPGEAFTKTWRLQNTGTCTWTKDYSMAVFSGEAMNAPSVVAMPSNVAPGQSVDISADLTAPNSSGTYQGNWKLRNKEGAWFGIGPGGSSPFWVRIVVAGSSITPSATLSDGTPYPSDGTPAPGVKVSGNTSMLLMDRINFDNGQINTGAGEDLGYVLDGEKPLLTPLNSALVAVRGGGTPSYADCLGSAYASSAIKLKQQNPGTYICYRTDQGLYGWVRLISLDANTGDLAIQYQTWKNP
jgi:Ig-like domain from next to BRCA1 gene